MSCRSRRAGTAYSDLLASVAGSTCVSARPALLTTLVLEAEQHASASAASRIVCSIHGW